MWRQGESTLPAIAGVAVAGAAAVITTATILLRRARATVSGEPAAPDSPDVFLELRVTDGASAGTAFRFQADGCATVGRKAVNSVCLSDTGISGRHFQITFNSEANVWQLVDTGSLNGTTLNRILVTSPEHGPSDPYSLRQGDRILIGERTVLEVHCSPSAPAPNDAQTVGDLLALELMARVTAAPPPPDIQASLRAFESPALRVRGCSVQKQATRAREKKSCEDTVAWALPVPDCQGLGVFCLCDGHCGDETSNHVQSVLPGVLAEELRRAPAAAAPAPFDALATVLTDTFHRIDGMVEGRDGCTMTVVALYADGAGAVCIQAANVGDSAVVCADFAQMMKMHLTDNHRVTHGAEQERLRETGSLLTHNGTRLMGLNLSRSIGDRVLKDMNPGFLATPYVSTVVRVEAGDALLVVLASDGLWDVTNANIVTRIAYRVLATHPGDVELLTRVLMEHAVSRRSKDDITIVVALVGDAGGAATGGASIDAHEAGA